MSDVVVSWIRTAVPGIWGALITWLLSAVDWLPTVLVFLQLDPTAPGVVAGVVVVAIAAWHAVWRKVEPHVPDWLSRIALGSSKTPTYTESEVEWYHTPDVTFDNHLSVAGETYREGRHAADYRPDTRYSSEG